MSVPLSLSLKRLGNGKAVSRSEHPAVRQPRMPVAGIEGVMDGVVALSGLAGRFEAGFEAGLDFVFNLALPLTFFITFFLPFGVVLAVPLACFCLRCFSMVVILASLRSYLLHTHTQGLGFRV